jgi:tetratricopeptide (TPR) repeat protein
VRVFVLANCLTLALSSVVFAATDQDYADCQQTRDLDRSIAGCTRILDDQSESAADRTVMYVRRGYDYLSKNDFDNAIADDSAALKLDPRNVFAVSNRAIAYARQGDRDRAIADYAKTRQIDPAAVAANRELVEIGVVAARAASLQNSQYLGDMIKNATEREAFRYAAYIARTPAPASPTDLPAWLRASSPVVKPTQALQEAMALVQQEITTANNNTYIMYGLLTLARVHAALGDKDAAAGEFERAFARADGFNRQRVILGELFAGYPKVSAAIENFIAKIPPPPPPFSATASDDEKTTIRDAANGREGGLIDAAKFLSFIGDTARAKQLLGEAKHIGDTYPDMIYNAAGLAAAFWLAGDSATAWQMLRNMALVGQAATLGVPKGLRSSPDRVLCGPYTDYLENTSASLRAVSDVWIRAHPSSDDTYLEYWRYRLADAVRTEIECGLHEKAARALEALTNFDKARPPTTRNAVTLDEFKWDNARRLMELRATLDGAPPPFRYSNDPAQRKLEMFIDAEVRSGNYQAAISSAVNDPTARGDIVEAAARADRIDVVRQVIAIEKFPYFHLTLATQALDIVAHLPELQ